MMSIKTRKRNTKKMTNRNVVYGVIVAVLLAIPFGRGNAQPKDRLYELYNSTSTPKQYKRAMEPMIKRRERMDQIRAKHALTVFKLGQVYAIPNPAVGVKHPVIHVEAGLADKVEIKIYDPAGKLVEEAALTEPPVFVGGVYAYEYKFLSNETPNGTYGYTVKAYKSGKQPIEASGGIMFIRTGN